MPEELFEPDKKCLLHYLFFMSAYLLGIYLLVHIQLLPIKFFISILMGIALAALTFFLHDLFHSSIVKSRIVSYFIGLSIGVFNLFAPLFWHRIHNFHHARTGNVDDPDRSYILSEKPKTAIEKFIYKIRISSESHNRFLSLFFISTGFFWYFLNSMSIVFFTKQASVTNDEKYERVQELFKSNIDKLIVVSELVLIFIFQSFLFINIAKFNLLNYFLISLLPIGIAHCIAMMYIHTNHFLSPLTGEVDDPLLNSLSLKDPPLVDTIFSHFSHHVEHHLFPAMSSSYYPKVRELLLKFYPDRFQLVTMSDAIKMLFSTPRIYAEDHVHLTTIDGSKKVTCLLPRGKVNF